MNSSLRGQVVWDNDLVRNLNNREDKLWPFSPPLPFCILVNGCYLYESAVEVSDHILLWCPFSHCFWETTLDFLNCRYVNYWVHFTRALGLAGFHDVNRWERCL